MYSQELRDKVFEDMIYFAAKYRADELAKELPIGSEIEKPHVFSDEFKNKMKRLIKTHKKAQSLKKLKKFLSKAIVIFIIIFSGTFLLVSNVEALKNPIVNFFIEIREEFTKITLNDKGETSANISDLEGIYLPTYVPHGYEMIERIAENGTYITTYKNDEDDILLFSQTNESKGISIDTEDAKFYETQIGEHNAYVSVKDDRLVVMTTLDKTLLTLSGKIDESTAIKIMESIELEK